MLALRCLVAGAEPGFGETGSEPTRLYLETWVNGMHRGTTPFESRGDTLWAPSAALKKLGFRLSGDDAAMWRIDALPSVTVDFDPTTQTIRMHAPLSSIALPTTIVEAQERASAAAVGGAAGVLLNYDVFGTRPKGAPTALSVMSEWRAFSGDAVLSHTVLGRLAMGAEAGGVQHRRLDTTWSRSFPAEAVTLRVGDVQSGSLPWTRSTRLGGVQLARNFALQPYLATVPLPSYFGSAVLPSALELQVNGVRQYLGQVPAGPFRLQGLPSVGASGTAQVILTDSLGRASTTTIPLYDVGKLLAPGLTDWSVEAGAVRRNYGLRSFDYARDLSFFGTLRRGITPGFTLEAHAQATRGVRTMGAGGVWQAGLFGVVSASLSGSRHARGAGLQAHLAYSWTRDGFNASFSGSRTRGDFQDIASGHGASPAMSAARATVGYGAAGIGNFSLSYVQLRNRHEQATRIASFQWLVPLGRAVSLGLGMGRDLSRPNARTLSMQLSWDFDGARSMSVGMQRVGARTHASAEARHSEAAEGGWSWRAGGDAGVRQAGRAEVAFAGTYGRVGAGVGMNDGRHEAFASASGAVLLMGDRLFASRRLDQSFAMVSTAGIAGVPVMLENRPVGSTDARGELLVAPLNAYQKNRVSIDPMQLPAHVRVDATEAYATPPDRGGASVRFSLAPVRSAVVVLTEEDGTPLPPGTEVRLDASREAVTLGYDGELYLERLGASEIALTALTRRGACRARFELPLAEAGIARVGPVACVSARPRS